MREIKFRVWDPAGQQMCPVIVADFQDIQAKVFCRLPKSGAQDIFSADLMQYTKWSEDQISTADILKLLPVQPLFGNRRGKTIWMVFMKFPEEESK